MKIKTLESHRTQGGLWVCDIWYTMTTDQQFTDEWHTARAVGKWCWLALFKAWLAARQNARFIASDPAVRRAQGWLD